MNRIRAMVVEDDAFTRSMIVSSLQMQGVDVVIETGSVTQAIKAGQISKPNVAILDLDLGSGPSGIDLALALRKANTKIGIVILTTFEDPRLHSPGLPELPNGSIYLVKREISDIELLFKEIKKTILESSALPKEVVKSLSKRSFGDLTDSQIETMRLIAKGFSNAQIAKNRGINEKSVEQTISRLAKQLKIESSVESNQRVQISRMYYKLTGSNSANDEN